LYNVGSQPVDVGGWAFTKGIKFKFPAGTRVEGQGFLVVCRNADRFKRFYDVPVAGVFDSKISRKGERIELADATGKRVDAVAFGDKAPWPTGADGDSGSLERICPTAASDAAGNWIASPLSESREKPTGTPGKPNAGFSATLPPVITAVKYSSELPQPEQPITVEAELPAGESVSAVNLRFRLAGPGYEKPETSVAMKSSAPGRYLATIPGQPAEQLIRFRVEAVGPKGARRFFPAETEPRPALSAYVPGTITPAQIPFGWIIHTNDKEKKAAEAQANGPMFGGFRPGIGGPPPGFDRRPGAPSDPPAPPSGVSAGPGGPRRGQVRPGVPGGPGPFRGGPFGQASSEPGSFTSAFVYFDPATRKTELFDFVQINGRKGGQKVHFYRDDPLDAMTTIALIFEGETAALVEPLAYEVYRRAGMPVEQSHYVRLWQDGRPTGYTLLIEQPNRAFLRRNRINDDGTMYKLLWFGGDLIGQHEKHSRKRVGHADLQEVVAGLEQRSGDDQWEFIQKNFDVEEVATYFAVNMVISHWDGFFNNYFTYHDSEGTGKWMMFPWDQDSTWGLRVMGGGRQVFYTMALTFGMNGDEPPEDGRGSWRPPGWFSGPLLANPKFRQVFLARTKQILEAVYTDAAFGPVLDRYAELLTPEVKVRAQLHEQDPVAAVERLQYDLARCREHLRLRREFLLRQPELKQVRLGK
ncbi:MAG TPA: CotH kinase family protein, partial [Verrucomicrobiota bacterium]|nr:CotH kinase family protein [Verrucomicrobiota bacterium]